MSRETILIGYSGHAYVAYDALLSGGYSVRSYAEREEKSNNPFHLHYLGNESETAVQDKLKSMDYFIAVGDNMIRGKIYNTLVMQTGNRPVNAMHLRAVVASTAQYARGILFAAGCIVNPFAKIGNGVICNSGSIIEHECTIGDFAHIAPGTVLCGNVTIGENSFVGANSVVREGITIGKNVIIGAGTVVTKNVPDNVKVVGNPFRFL
jgi:sugar O-acyltransferase (sialic acid O-acetyltransferase NeuD family)